MSLLAPHSIKHAGNVTISEQPYRVCITMEEDQWTWLVADGHLSEPGYHIPWSSVKGLNCHLWGKSCLLFCRGQVLLLIAWFFVVDSWTAGSICKQFKIWQTVKNIRSEVCWTKQKTIYRATSNSKKIRVQQGNLLMGQGHAIFPPPPIHLPDRATVQYWKWRNEE